MPKQLMTADEIVARTDQVIMNMRDACLEHAAVPLLCIAGVTGAGNLPVGTYFTINCQNRSDIEVLGLLKTIVRTLEARMT